ncbi:MAG: hypothetical protein PHN52_11485 [candidate division Zixibacteria bacterium]|nr:hypothetical protein [candidate division Zixibacteria bacterium]
MEFSNWGVPITKEELEKELIFQVGYRGLYSRDRGRLGTGIGLPDARQVARQHGGDITITCVSAAGDKTGRDTYKDSEKYSDPYLTIVTLKLPLERIE